MIAGTAAPILVPDPQSLLLLHGAAGQNLGLMRVAPDGRALWRVALPMPAVRSVLPGPHHLVLMTGNGAPEMADAVLVSVALLSVALLSVGLWGFSESVILCSLSSGQDGGTPAAPGNGVGRTGRDLRVRRQRAGWVVRTHLPRRTTVGAPWGTN